MLKERNEQIRVQNTSNLTSEFTAASTNKNYIPNQP